MSDDVSTSSVVNPFEEGLLERLSGPTLSPTFFKQQVTPEEKKDDESEFKWSIEQRSGLFPSHIEVSYQLTPIATDKEKDKKIQSVIEKFFREHTIAPSPYCDTPGPSRSRVDGFGKDVGVQTALSLPPVLPSHVEEVLRPYISLAQIDRDDDETNTSLRRKLRFPSETSLCEYEVENKKDSRIGYTSDDSEENESKNGACHDEMEFNSPASARFSSSPMSSPNFSRSDCNPQIPLKSPSVSPIARSFSPHSFRLKNQNKPKVDSTPDNKDLGDACDAPVELKDAATKCLFTTCDESSQESGLSRDTGYSSQEYTSTVDIQQDGRGWSTSGDSFLPTESSTPKSFNAILSGVLKAD